MCDAQVSEKLAAVNWCQRFDCLDFYDHGLFNDQVGSIGAVDLHALIEQRKFLLRLDLESRRYEFVTKAAEVRLLEDTWSTVLWIRMADSIIIEVMRLISWAERVCVMPL